MYTLSPVLDQTASHFGFWLVVGFWLVIVIVFLGSAYLDDELCWSGGTRFAMACIATPATVFIAIAYHNSYNDGAIPPKNEKVILTRSADSVSFGPYTYRSGKQNVTITAPYVFYDTPDGQVSFKMGDGQPWPNQIIAYKN